MFENLQSRIYWFVVEQGCKAESINLTGAEGIINEVIKNKAQTLLF
jgi:hypothetical protein